MNELGRDLFSEDLYLSQIIIYVLRFKQTDRIFEARLPELFHVLSNCIRASLYSD